MGHMLGAKHPLESADAAEFRLYVLAGCRRLSCDDVSDLADELHACVRERRERAADAGASHHDQSAARLSA